MSDMQLTDGQIHCLKHALGLTDHSWEWRNYYYASIKDHRIVRLVEKGLMEWYGETSKDGHRLAMVTDTGKAVAWAHMPDIKSYACWYKGDFVGIHHGEDRPKAQYQCLMKLQDSSGDDSFSLIEIRAIRCKEADGRDPYRVAKEMGWIK
jgi:hypothetical protein